jgi:hypothetical protein
VRVALYVTGHGFGHAVRCAQVARALVRRGAEVLVRSEAPLWLFPGEVHALPAPEGAPVDVGVAQHGGLELDIAETRRRWTVFARDFDAHASREAASLRQAHVDVVLGDVPPLAFAAAARARVPGWALANFGWDWIYAVWPDFEPIVERIRAAYAQADSLLRLPLHSPADDAFPAFRHVQDVPLIARLASRSRAEVRADLGVPTDRRLVLLSFGGFHASGLDLDALGEWRDYLFLLTPPLTATRRSLPANVLTLADRQDDYVSLLAACDAVVTKPGYGIVADCLANRVPVVYTDRGPFREYEVLADALERLGRACYAPRADILAGHLGPHLDRLLGLSTAWSDQPLDGAERVADVLLR